MKTLFSRSLLAISVLTLLLSGGVPASFASSVHSSSSLLVNPPIDTPGRKTASQPLDHSVYLPLVAAAPPVAWAVKISAGEFHTCTLTGSGGVRCWGDNEYGQLGDGTTIERHLPVDVVGLSNKVTAIVEGGYHTCALTENGAVKCWGWNLFGQLGDGTVQNRIKPVDVLELSSGVFAITAGDNYTCALTASGVKCWGANWNGRLGDGTADDRYTPVDVVGLSSGIIAITAGNNHTCALTANGGIKCWGKNYWGQLGDGTTDDRYTPVDVVGLSNGMAAVAAGGSYASGDHTCALTESGEVKCWGNNYWGQLGDGTTDNRYTPVHVVGISSEVNAIAIGSNHTCALTSSGGVKCWGGNYSGQLGDGTFQYRITPVDVVGLSSGVMEIAAGYDYTCALSTSDDVKCWGDNYWGQLGDGTTINRGKPVAIVRVPIQAAAIAAGDDHTCALTIGAAARCWGNNEYGQLGDGRNADHRLTPGDIAALSNGVTVMAAGGTHTCALIDNGGARCWGWDYYGQLGDGANESQNTPVDVLGLSSGVAAIAVGELHTCALTANGGVKCWGWNLFGQLGDGTNESQNAPVDVVGLSSGVTAIAAGADHTCVLTENGGVKCWGANDFGQLGNGSNERQNTPVDVMGLSSGVTAIAAGGFHTCALIDSGNVKCWGLNDSGQLGNGATENQNTPVDVAGLSSGVAAIAAGNYHTCVLTASGGVLCWGWNFYGQLGDGTTNDRLSPVNVAGLIGGVAMIGAGDYHTCALTTGGGILCWGSNSHGQLGDGTNVERLTPVDVVGFGEAASGQR